MLRRRSLVTFPNSGVNTMVAMNTVLSTTPVWVTDTPWANKKQESEF